MKNAKLIDDTQNQIEKYRGRREVYEINIKTFESMEIDDAEDKSGREVITVPLKHSSKGASSKEPTPENMEEEGKEPSPSLSEALRSRDQISFVSGNPFVESTKGILHLFKEE